MLRYGNAFPVFCLGICKIASIVLFANCGFYDKMIFAECDKSV